MSFYQRFSEILAREYQVVIELIKLAEEQQSYLIAFNTEFIAIVAEKQDILLKELFELEGKRFELISVMAKVSSYQAKQMTMTQIMAFFPTAQQQILNNFKQKSAKLLAKLNKVNTNNRILALRGKRSVSELLKYLNENTKQVCNVQI